jgi:hypothetical protein
LVQAGCGNECTNEQRARLDEGTGRGTHEDLMVARHESVEETGTLQGKREGMGHPEIQLRPED